MSPLSALIVEDDPHFRESLAALVAREGFATREVGSLAAAREALEEAPADAVLVDLGLPDGDGLDLLRDEGLPISGDVLVITGKASLESAVAALREGARDYLSKPVDRARLKTVLGHVARAKELSDEVQTLRRELRELGRFGPMVGRSQAMQQVYQLVERVAPTDATVFVTGESGTGKELVAETVHRLSARKHKPFLPVNCGAMSPTLIESELFGHEKGAFTGAERRRSGYFEKAHGGTLFLDEITEMPVELQVKLLRVLETGKVLRVGGSEPVEVDVRFITASNRDPEEAVEGGDLREDLLYRLNVFPITLPTLREREGDAILLARHFLEELNRRDGAARRWSDEALARIETLPWPGNVRELKNAVERAFILSDDVIGPDTLPAPTGESGKAPAPDVEAELRVRVGSSIADAERRLILATLDAFDGDKKRAAEVLGISLKTLYNRLNVYEAQDRAGSEGD